jgi:ribosomal protein S18 acetylase RimI-like enzyme
MVGHDGHRGWVYYVAVDPDRQGQDFGRAIMAAAEDWLRARDVTKVMLMVRPDNVAVQAFYDRLGYDVQERVIYAKWLDGREMTP